ncbi:MAG: malonyl-ACP O-methyltransferase BioC [Neisseria sp.]|nr:malonyl-ACP O-methyltransferase BioC [Neisseria sp.]
MPYDKRQIARNFSAAAERYDSAADIQRESGRLLLEHAGSTFSDNLNGQILLDIGAGSGRFSRQLQTQGAEVYALDLAEGMLRHIRRITPDFPCILADAEHLPLPENSADFCFSNLTVQWCSLSRTLAEMRRVTKPGGTIAVSTLADGSLAQLKQAWQAADSSPHVNTFLNTSDITSAAADADIRLHNLTARFPCLRELLHSLKTIGANHVGNRSGGLTGKHRWQRFVQTYEAFRDTDGLYPLDYRIATIVIRLP